MFARLTLSSPAVFLKVILKIRPLPLFCFLLLCPVMLFCPCNEAEAARHNVGFVNLGISLPERELNLDINVWYPTESRRRRTFKFQSWTFRAASRAAVSPGTWPLVLLSHPSSGNRLTHHTTASALAACGFIVAAMTHPDDNLDNMPDIASWDLFVHRVRDMGLLIDILLKEERFAASIDRERIGVLGFGTGAATALLLGGALPDCTQWKNFCRDNTSLRNPYCNEWARERISRNICPSLPLRQSMADVRIKACALVEPAFTALFSRESLSWYYPPTLLVQGQAGRDQTLEREDALFATRFGRTIRRLNIAAADEAAFMAPCPDPLLKELPELCYSVDDRLRSEIHEQLVSALDSFFTATLVRRPPQAMPDPPVFEFVGPVQPERPIR